MIKTWTIRLAAVVAALFMFSGSAIAAPSCPGPDDGKKTVKTDKKTKKDDA